MKLFSPVNGDEAAVFADFCFSITEWVDGITSVNKNGIKTPLGNPGPLTQNTGIKKMSSQNQCLRLMVSMLHQHLREQNKAQIKSLKVKFVSLKYAILVTFYIPGSKRDLLWRG